MAAATSVKLSGTAERGLNQPGIRSKTLSPKSSQKGGREKRKKERNKQAKEEEEKCRIMKQVFIKKYRKLK